MEKSQNRRKYDPNDPYYLDKKYRHIFRQIDPMYTSTKKSVSDDEDDLDIFGISFKHERKSDKSGSGIQSLKREKTKKIKIPEKKFKTEGKRKKKKKEDKDKIEKSKEEKMKKVLKGKRFFVEVIRMRDLTFTKINKDNVEELGGFCYKILKKNSHKKLTAVIFESGFKETISFCLTYNIPVLKPGWLSECKKKMAFIDFNKIDHRKWKYSHSELKEMELSLISKSQKENLFNYDKLKIKKKGKGKKRKVEDDMEEEFKKYCEENGLSVKHDKDKQSEADIFEYQNNFLQFTFEKLETEIAEDEKKKERNLNRISLIDMNKDKRMSTLALTSYFKSTWDFLIGYQGDVPSIQIKKLCKLYDREHNGKRCGRHKETNYKFFTQFTLFLRFSSPAGESLALAYCIANGIPVVNKRWFDDCIKQKKFLDYNLKLYKEKFRNNLKGIFKNHVFSLIRKGNSKQSEQEEAVVSDILDKVGSEIAEITEADVTIILKSVTKWAKKDTKDAKKTMNFSKGTPKVVNVKWLIDSVVQGEMVDFFDPRYSPLVKPPPKRRTTNKRRKKG